ncbi:MAG: hypothetical protein HY079_02785 [Elusimicrobia bacterium]|nr:hypothetical protein [Elusimicrobiota bacterium]
MKAKAAAAWKRWNALFDETEDPAAPRYDPVHLATVLVACQVVAGALFWLLWTLLVYEGGLPRKVVAVLTRWSDPAADTRMLRYAGPFGGPGHATVFEGWAANLTALVLAVALVAALQRLDRRHGKRPR